MLSVAFQAAALGDNKPSTWGKGHLKLYTFCGLIYLCSTMNVSYMCLLRKGTNKTEMPTGIRWVLDGFHQ